MKKGFRVPYKSSISEKCPRVPAWHPSDSDSAWSHDIKSIKTHCGTFTARLDTKSCFGCRTIRYYFWVWTMEPDHSTSVYIYLITVVIAISCGSLSSTIQVPHLCLSYLTLMIDTSTCEMSHCLNKCWVQNADSYYLHINVIRWLLAKYVFTKICVSRGFLLFLFVAKIM